MAAWAAPAIWLLGDLSQLAERDTSFVLVSTAPLARVRSLRRKGWDRPWYSSFGSEFNYDFHVTVDENVAPPEYNYRSKPGRKGERPGTSVFFLLGDDIFHTYSTFAHGGEYLTSTSPSST